MMFCIVHCTFVHRTNCVHLWDCFFLKWKLIDVCNNVILYSFRSGMDVNFVAIHRLYCISDLKYYLKYLWQVCLSYRFVIHYNKWKFMKIDLKNNIKQSGRMIKLNGIHLELWNFQGFHFCIILPFPAWLRLIVTEQMRKWEQYSCDLFHMWVMMVRGLRRSNAWFELDDLMK